MVEPVSDVVAGERVKLGARLGDLRAAMPGFDGAAAAAAAAIVLVQEEVEQSKRSIRGAFAAAHALLDAREAKFIGEVRFLVAVCVCLSVCVYVSVCACLSVSVCLSVCVCVSV